MEGSRPTPFTLVFGGIAEERFPHLRDGIAAAGRDPHDRDGFLLVREVVELLQELRPEAGLGPAVDALVGFVHRAYLYWMDGARTAVVHEEALRAILAGRPEASPGGSAAAGATRYIQLPARRVWGVPVAGAPPEPLDGWFVTVNGEVLSLLAVFGIHRGRDGFTSVEVDGPRPRSLRRPDGTPLFTPALAGGREAGLHSVEGMEELLELAWRLEASA